MFQPTFLYIKQHTITGMLYFGKTQGKNPNKYNGSGTYWKKKKKKYGKDKIETLWFCLFCDEDDIVNFAMNFSISNNIIQSKLWANQINEDGLNGGQGHKNLVLVRGTNQKCFLIEKTDQRWINKEVVAFNRGMKASGETKEKLKIAQANIWTEDKRKEQSKICSGENNPMFGKTKEKHWRFNKDLTIETISAMLKSGHTVKDIAEKYECSLKAVRCRILKETNLNFKQWKKQLFSKLE